jgi:hypothetical protein
MYFYSGAPMHLLSGVDTYELEQARPWARKKPSTFVE